MAFTFTDKLGASLEISIFEDATPMVKFHSDINGDYHNMYFDEKQCRQIVEAIGRYIPALQPLRSFVDTPEEAGY